MRWGVSQSHEPVQVISSHSRRGSNLIFKEALGRLHKHRLRVESDSLWSCFVGWMCFMESQKNLSASSASWREKGSGIQSCQVFVFRLRCDKLSQSKRAVKSSLQEQAFSPCKSGQSSAHTSSISQWEWVTVRSEAPSSYDKDLCYSIVCSDLSLGMSVWFCVCVLLCADV